MVVGASQEQRSHPGLSASLVLDGTGHVRVVHGDIEPFLDQKAMKLIGHHIQTIRPFHNVGDSILATMRAVGGPIRLQMAPAAQNSLIAQAEIFDDHDENRKFEITLFRPDALPKKNQIEESLAETSAWNETLHQVLDEVGIGLIICTPDEQGRWIPRHANHVSQLILGTDVCRGGGGASWPPTGFSERGGFVEWGREEGSSRILKVSVQDRRLFDRPAKIYFVQDFTVQQRREAHRRHLLHELEVKNQDLAVFSRSMAHDLKEPVRNMSTFAALLSKRISEGLDAPQQDMLTFIHEGGQRATAMIDNLLRLIRLGPAAMRPAKIELDALLEEIKADLQPDPDGPTSLTWDKGSSLYGDPYMVRHILLNLIQNGLKYNQDAQPKVHVRCEQGSTQATIYISDNGIGIPKGKESEIFEPFKRFSTEGAAGTGIGLTICRRMVELHGGSIHADTLPDGGSVVKVRLPCEPAS